MIHFRSALLKIYDRHVPSAAEVGFDVGIEGVRDRERNAIRRVCRIETEN